MQITNYKQGLIMQVNMNQYRDYKSSGTAYLLWALCFVGLAGLHRFYLGKPWTAILFFFTFGLFGIGLVYDAITISSQVDEINNRP